MPLTPRIAKVLEKMELPRSGPRSAVATVDPSTSGSCRPGVPHPDQACDRAVSKAATAASRKASISSRNTDRFVTRTRASDARSGTPGAGSSGRARIQPPPPPPPAVPSAGAVPAPDADSGKWTRHRAFLSGRGESNLKMFAND
jgi:hypothetical protein